MRWRGRSHVVYEEPFLRVERSGLRAGGPEVYTFATFAGEPHVVLSPLQLAELVAALQTDLAGGDYVVIRRSSRGPWQEVRRG